MRKLLALRKILCADAALITDEQDVCWLTGFTGDSSQALVTENAAYFLTDFRYTEQAKKQLKHFVIVETTASERLSRIEELLQSESADMLGIDYSKTTLKQMEDYGNAFSAEFIDIEGVLPALRAIKDACELDRMRKGAAITEAAYSHILGYIKPDVAERDIYAELIYFFHKNGAEPSFPPIVASGENASMPHAGAGDRRFKRGDFITMDFGVKYLGVCTDFTRTIALFGVAERQKMIYNTVWYAQRKGLAALRPGITGREADAAARGVIDAAGFKECFGHGTGHGVGAEIHEAPRLSPMSEDVLQEGMVVTVEPGIYLAGNTGVRIEDMAVITKDGCENFYTADKELIII